VGDKERCVLKEEEKMKNSKSAVAVFIVFVAITLTFGSAFAAKKPNILVIWGDDIGWFNISAYNDGMMGYKTPNIDRIGNEGVRFTDAYGQNSCTAGRAAFITGQSPFRTGLLKVGLPGAKEGLYKEDPTIAELLKPMGYVTGQFGKNHLGDLDEHLPSNHGFDEFFGNLYHLNAEEEPENEDYPKDPAFKKKFGPRGVIHSFAKIKDKLLKGHKVGSTKYKVHLDGYNLLPSLTGQAKEWPRTEMFYFTDDGSLSALRYNDWKMQFSEQRATVLMYGKNHW
jgi:arylsulfatase A-like enzyme